MRSESLNILFVLWRCIVDNVFKKIKTC